MQECLRRQAAGPPRSASDRFWGRSPLAADARSWYAGAVGEIAVARVLDGLGPGWTVLHSVPVGSGDSDIDHVVVGPPGVLTINTKHHDGQRVWAGGSVVMVGGHKTWHVRNSRHEADRASRLLSAAAGMPVPVQPLLVVVGAASIRFGKTPPAVPVLTPGQLARSLRSQRPVQSPAAVEFLSMVAEERGTWHTRAVVLDDTLRHEQRFHRLQRDIALARRRRRRWLLGAGLGLVVGIPAACMAVVGAAVASLVP